MYNGVVVSDCDSDHEGKADIKARDTYSYSTGNRAMGNMGLGANRKLPDLPKTPESTGQNQRLVKIFTSTRVAAKVWRKVRNNIKACSPKRAHNLCLTPQNVTESIFAFSFRHELFARLRVCDPERAAPSAGAAELPAGAVRDVTAAEAAAAAGVGAGPHGDAAAPAAPRHRDRAQHAQPAVRDQRRAQHTQRAGQWERNIHTHMRTHRLRVLM